MTRIRSFLKKKYSTRLPYAQILFVFLAFALTGLGCYILTVSVERQHLEGDAHALSENIEEQFNADLKELKTMLGIVSETIRRMMIQGVSYEEVTSYMTDMTNFGVEANIVGFLSIFAMFDIYKWPEQGGFSGNAPDTDWADMHARGLFTPQEREWYIVANEANGEIASTEPYVDVLTRETAFSYSRCIYDDDGNRIAVIGINVLIDRIYSFSSERKGLGVHTWMLLDRNMIIIAYPFPEFIGMHIREAEGSGINDIAYMLEKGDTIQSHRFVNPLGSVKVHSVRRLNNGWYLGVSTPIESYHANMRNILLFLVIFGFLMASALSAILLRIYSQMMRADKAAHTALKEKDMLSNLGNIMNGLDVMIYVTEPVTGEIIFMNDSMKKHYSIEGDCVGQLCYKLLQQDLNHRCEFCPCFKLDKDPDTPIVWEEHSSLTNRIYRNVDRYITWPNGKRVHMQYSVDTTELVAAKEYAEQSSRYKSAFLANMSHEIRTPMNAILGIAEIQLQNKSLSYETEEAISKIYESGDLLLNIINDILDLSKIEAGKLELVPVKYDIPSLINDTAQLNRLRFESTPVQFVLEINEHTPHDLFGDELRIKQVLNNILSNAFKYTSKGEIKLAVSSEAADDPQTGDDNVIVVFAVSDTGQGMTEKQVSALFDEYTRFNLEANRTTVGTGLGMSITKRLVDLMNGRISVESELGKGSVFTVRIPQKKVGEALCGTELADKLRNFRFSGTAISKKVRFLREYMPYGSVIVVDDVESNLYVAKGMLLPYGLKVETVSSGFEMIEKIKNGKTYDIIFMDHMMPKMDGIEAVKIIREMGYNGLIIALTANALVGQAEMFLKNGFDGFISKPIDSREMNLLLNDFIRNRKPPEVVEEARQKQRERENKNMVISAQDMSKASDLEKFFIMDTENVLNVLEGLKDKLENLDEAGMYSYIIAVHGIKSALANVGEKNLSEVALRLERAGRARDLDTIAAETPALINALQTLIDNYRSAEDERGSINGDDTISDNDRDYLRKKLLIIKNACAEIDKKTAKDALKDLKQKTWPKNIENVLDDIALQLLHSEFRKAAVIADGYL